MKSSNASGGVYSGVFSDEEDEWGQILRSSQKVERPRM